MILIGSEEIPLSSEEWTTALQNGVKNLISRSESVKVCVEGETESNLDLKNITLEVQGGEFDTSISQKAGSFNKLSIGPNLKQINLWLSAVSVEEVPVFIKVDGKDLGSEILRDSEGRLWLAPRGMQSDSLCNFLGKVQLSDVKKLIEKKAVALAKKNGAALTNINVHFNSISDHEVEVQVNLEGRKFGMSAGIAAAGKLEIDANCDLIITQLELSGTGGMGSMVASLLSPEVKKWSGKKIAISQFVFNGLTISDIKLSVDTDITITASASFAG